MQSSAHKAGALPFVDNDYPRALAEAKRRGVPLFVDAWAPWCHTCLSLRAFVLADPSLAPLGERFVFASIDTEKAQNEAFVARFPLEFWPTLWVIDPTTEQATLKWPGSLTRDELVALLDDVQIDAKKQGPVEQLRAQGDRQAAEGKRDAAIESYRRALEQCPPSHRARPRLVDALAGQLMLARQHEACASLTEREHASLPRGTNRANVLVAGLSCARKLEGQKARASALAAALLDLANDRSFALLADDRSSLFEEVVDTQRELGDEAAARQTAALWRDFVDAQARAASSPDERAVFESHRALAHAEADGPDKALPVLEAAVRAYPGDYNPHARLAKTLHDLGRHDEALAEVEQALKLAYGPRRLRLWSLRASIELSRGDREAARKTLDAAIEQGRKMTLPGSYKKALDSLQSKRAALDAAPAR